MIEIYGFGNLWMHPTFLCLTHLALELVYILEGVESLILKMTKIEIREGFAKNGRS